MRASAIGKATTRAIAITTTVASTVTRRPASKAGIIPGIALQSKVIGTASRRRGRQPGQAPPLSERRGRGWRAPDLESDTIRTQFDPRPRSLSGNRRQVAHAKTVFLEDG